jgi:thioredoxin reductase (NADPH)
MEDDHEIAALAVALATGAQYRRLPVEGLSRYEGVSVFYAAGPPEAQLCGAERVAVVGGGNSAGQAAVWLARGGALVTLLHRRADLRETMIRLSHPRARALRRGHPRPQRDRGAARRRRRTRGGDAGERRAPAALVLVSVPRRTALTEWRDDVVTRDENGFILTGGAAGAEYLLESTIPGVFAAGDVR